MLKLENYSVAYGESSVIKDLNLEIKDNEIVALLGRNGMGKTTASAFRQAELSEGYISGKACGRYRALRSTAQRCAAYP